MGKAFRAPRRTLRTRFWPQTGLAILSGALFVLTLVRRDWLEAFGLDPDHHDGGMEWLIVGALGLVCVTSVLIARLEWRAAALAG